MPSIAKVPLSAEVSVPADSLLAVFRSLLFNPFVLVTGLSLVLTVVLRKFLLPIVSLAMLEQQVQELNEFLTDAEKHYIPTESSHRNVLSELEGKVSTLKRRGYKIQHLKAWTSTERTRLRAMAEVEGEKQAFNKFIRARRRGLARLAMPDHTRGED
ncbi:hypothetical protein L218DRAFT_1005082 [Marasmius fiardii PR-910]|nr:hypothetical protein L218DRAFT_1005082 [Marasmius fiardii PR-910]